MRRRDSGASTCASDAKFLGVRAAGTAAADRKGRNSGELPPPRRAGGLLRSGQDASCAPAGRNALMNACALAAWAAAVRIAFLSCFRILSHEAK